ncbi:MAG: aminoglycoside phosphotransferase family protein [Deltaproteobacteria bacterium]|nr:aminoglycoside phosphotransferase family protein [Deltaproteobacteria bacterium]
MTSDANQSTAPFKSLTQADRKANSASAIAAAVSVAESYGVKVVEPIVLADRYAIRVHLSPAPLVARVSTFTALLRPPIEAWLARELDVTRFLHERGAPVVPPSDLIPPGPYLKNGFAISFWTHVKPVSEELPTPEVTGKMLAELHQVLRDYPGELPLLAPPLNDIPMGIERLERMGGILPTNEVSMLRKVADRLLPAIREVTTPIQPLHGDAHAYNLISTDRGLLWNDFEDTCKGPIAWDLSTLFDTEGKMLGAYPGAPPASELELYQQARLLQGVVWVFALSPEIDEWVTQAREMLDTVRNLA